jgi:hypothetical protein
MIMHNDKRNEKQIKNLFFSIAASNKETLIERVKAREVNNSAKKEIRYGQ